MIPRTGGPIGMETSNYFTMKKYLLPIFFVFTTASWAKPPNVVLILSDDQSYTDYGFMGIPTSRRPTLTN